MEKGTLEFAIDGEYFGIAFTNSALTIGPIWPAVSMMHVGGCTLVAGLKKPDYFVN